MNKSIRLRELLRSGQTLVMPDAFDAISARIIERSGFQAVQCTGFGIALAACRCRESALGLEENIHITRHIVEAVSVPVMADGEDGFGDASVIGDTIRRYIEVGAAGINVEDQIPELPNVGIQVVDCQFMVDKIMAARLAATEVGHADFIINGRTDALAVNQDRAAGLKEAIERANCYLEAGADLAFVTRVAKLEEVQLLVREISGPVSIAAGMPYNMNLSIADLKQCGVARVSLPVLAVLASIQAMKQTLSDVFAGENFTRIAERGMVCSMKEATELLS